MTVQIVESTNNPFSDYFARSNPSYHQTILNHYVKTIELVIDGNTSVLLTEFRKDTSKKADAVLIYFCGFDDYFYHLHLFKYDKKDFDIIVVDFHGFGYNKRYPANDLYPADHRFNYYDNSSDIVNQLSLAFRYISKVYNYKKSICIPTLLVVILSSTIYIIYNVIINLLILLGFYYALH